MYKKISFYIIIFCFIFVLTGCSNQVDSLKRKNLKEFYVKGDYSKELHNKQKQLSKKGKTYFKIVESKSKFDKIVKKYNLYTPRQEFTLNYNKKYFKQKSIVFIFPEQGAPNLSFWVKDIVKKKGKINILIEKYVPKNPNSKKVNHALLVEMYKNSYKDANDFKISIKLSKPEIESISSDINLAGICLGMNKSEVDKKINIKPIKEQKLKFKNEILDHIKYDGLEVAYKKDKVVMILISTPDFSTNKGLKVEDKLSKVKKLYGKPSMIGKTKLEGFDKYIYNYGNKKEFQIVINNNKKVHRIQLDKSEFIK